MALISSYQRCGAIRNLVCMKKLILLVLWPLCLAAQKNSFLPFRSYPFPTKLNAARHGARIAWAVNEEGKRNIYVAEGPAYNARKLTSFDKDEGLEITSLNLSDDGKWVVFVRGGDHGANWGFDDALDPSSSGKPFKVQVASIPFTGGAVKYLSEGDYPVISPDSRHIAFVKDGQVWSASLGGASAAAELFKTSGDAGSLQWSPDGKHLLFVSYREGHSLIGVFRLGTPGIQWIAPSFYNDDNPQWSPDGSKIVFTRTRGGGGAPDSMLAPKPVAWSICMADTATGNVSELWSAPATPRGSMPTGDGGVNLDWANSNSIVFMTNEDGWPHLYSINPGNGKKTLLTPGAFICEHVRLTPDRQHILFSCNTGGKDDLERRHIAMASTAEPGMKILTPGEGLEWSPAMTGEGKDIVFISATATRPPLPAVLRQAGDKFNLISGGLARSFPVSQMVVPKPVSFTSKDGVLVHADLFEPAPGMRKGPAIVYIHGGPPRQMLLGWHYSDYYSAAYASNQYLASLGFIVLSVNYRLGIGYGYEFSAPAGAGMHGASEYQDIKAAGEWLQQQPGVDATRIGVYGGSYGGYLTALALCRDSRLFAAGVAIHGVFDWVEYNHLAGRFNGYYEKAPDYEAALQTAWASSPVSAVAEWKSPVLIIHADEDRNVGVSQSIDIINRLRGQGVPYETMMIPGDTHHWMKFGHSVNVYQAAADYFVKKFLVGLQH